MATPDYASSSETGPEFALPSSPAADTSEGMRYVMRQKLFSFGDDFTIKNAEGDDVYFVDGRAFSIGKKLSFQDMNGNELLFIRQKLLAWGQTYLIYRDEELQATVKKSLFTPFRCKFSIDVPGDRDPEAQGNFLDHEYTFTRDGEVIAEVSKKWFSFSDTYGVEVHSGEDDVMILASTVVIDMACHTDKE